MKLPKFLVGLLIGGLLGLIFWYWQKSTSAEDGALSVLDRLAASNARIRDLESRLRMASTEQAASPNLTEQIDLCAGAADGSELAAENLQEIEGIGPTYARRLQDAGIYSFADLARQTPLRLMEITAVRSESTAKSWIDAAQKRVSG
jgi:predicted flap endonuclease-1-like 5' DNA nuclease